MSERTVFIIVSGTRLRGTPDENILLLMSERRFYVISVLFGRFKGLFLNARKTVSVRIR